MHINICEKIFILNFKTKQSKAKQKMIPNKTNNLTVETEIEEFLRSSNFFTLKLIRQFNIISILAIVIYTRLLILFTGN